MPIATTNEEWTEERVARLTELWAAGSSAKAIAADLGGFGDTRDGGRSAVIGKIHRLKLPHPEGKLIISKAPRKKAAPARQPFLAPPPAPRTRPEPLPRRNQTNSLAEKLAILEAEPGLPEKLKGDKPDGTGVKLIDLDSATCRWPKGDPADPDFEFCGGYALKDRPYCSFHSRIAYEPPKARVRHDKWALAGAELKA